MEFWQKVALRLKAKQPPVDFGCIMSYGGTIELMEDAMSYFLVILFMSFLVSSVNANNESIEKAIAASDPIALRYALISGFSVTADEKKQLLDSAKQITNTTYMNLNQKSIYDVFNFASGALKIAGALAVGYSGYQSNTY